MKLKSMVILIIAAVLLIAGCDPNGGTITFTDPDGNAVTASLSDAYFGLAAEGGIDISFSLEEADGDIWIYGFQLSTDATDISTLSSGAVTAISVNFLKGGDAAAAGSAVYTATDVSLDYVVNIASNTASGTVQVTGTITITVSDQDVIQTWALNANTEPGNLTNCSGTTGGYAITQMLYLHNACDLNPPSR